jgi:hypothetical protein
MAWVWWLLAPAASTAAGAWLFWLRGQYDISSRRSRRSGIEEHQALLRALPGGHDVANPPVTILVLSGVDASDPTGSAAASVPTQTDGLPVEFSIRTAS